MNTVRVQLGLRGYDIAITHYGAEEIAPFVRSALGSATSALVVCDSNTMVHASPVGSALVSNGFRGELAIVDAGESAKCLSRLSELYDSLYEMAADRTTAVIAVGGGVIGDLAGFAAATYNRGLPLVMVPTTLLAMVDSSVGGKTGINHPRGKNLIGAFHQPSAVWIDLAYLNTLPQREYVSGLAEVVKYGVALDAEFFAQLEQSAKELSSRSSEFLLRVVAHSCRLKADVVQRDEFETTGLRAVLNYGHTFGHAFETISGYSGLLHGEAVAIGMMYAARLALRLSLIDAEFVSRQEALLSALGLPVKPPGNCSTRDLIACMRRDKKALGGRMRFILPVRIGEVKLIDDVPEALVREVLEEQ